MKTFSSLFGAAALAAMLAGCAPGVDPRADVNETPAETTPTPVVENKLPEVPDSLKSRIELAIAHVAERDMRVNNAFWTIYHGVLTFGDGLTLLDPRSGDRVKAIDYILDGSFEYGEIRGMRFFPTKHGLDVQMGPTYVGQGHQDYFLSILALWDIPVDRKVVVYNREYTVDDFVKHAQATARLGQELSWTIIVLAKYRGTDIEWVNDYGERLHYDDLLRYEAEADIKGAPCGGTHRLGGLTWVYNYHMSHGGEETEVWKQVAARLEEHLKIAREYQNPDGTFSTDYFAGPGADPDIQQRIGSTGHTLEWLAGYLDDEELRSDWMQEAAGVLSMMFLETQSSAIESGALYHAARGLVVYYERVFGFDDAAIEKKMLSLKDEATSESR